MQSQDELGRAPAVVEETWKQERDSDYRRSFIESRLAAPALVDIELEADLPLAA